MSKAFPHAGSFPNPQELSGNLPQKGGPRAELGQPGVTEPQCHPEAASPCQARAGLRAPHQYTFRPAFLAPSPPGAAIYPHAQHALPGQEWHEHGASVRESF